MCLSSVRFNALAMLVGLLVMAGNQGIAVAQSPTSDRPSSISDGEFPMLELTPAPLQARSPQQTEQKIRAALEGLMPVGDADPVLDEILQIIHRRGSVLHGTMLDPEAENDQLVPGSETVVELTASEVDKRALAAEMLLRSARMLSKLVLLDRSQRELVANMRQEAVKLLSP